MQAMLNNPYLEKALLDHCLPSTLLLVGAEAKTQAIELAARLLDCAKERIEANNHPDYHQLSPEGKSLLHPIESIRSAIEESHKSGFEGKANVFVIESADRMQPASANALLKTLEEPSLDSTWILLSERPQDILPTIASRCVKVSIQEAFHPSRLSEEGQILKKILQDKPSYLTVSAELEKIEKLIEGEEAQKKSTELLKLLSQHVYELAGQCPHLPYDWEEALLNVSLGIERNIKLSTCLEYMFVKCKLI